MVDFHGVVEITDPMKPFLLDSKVMLPMQWLASMVLMQNLSLEKPLTAILDAKRSSVRWFGQFILALDEMIGSGGDWPSLNCPDWAYMDLTDHKTYKMIIRPNTFRCQRPKKDPFQVCTRPYLIGSDNDISYTTSSGNEERMVNETILFMFIKGKYPVYLDRLLLSDREVASSIPVRTTETFGKTSSSLEALRKTQAGRK